ncbi:hypothetical protein [Nonomuraea sp. NPDC002799]
MFREKTADISVIAMVNDTDLGERRSRRGADLKDLWQVLAQTPDLRDQRGSGTRLPDRGAMTMVNDSGHEWILKSLTCENIGLFEFRRSTGASRYVRSV